MLGMGGSLSADPASLVFEDLTSYKDLAFYYKNGVDCGVERWDDSSGNNNHIIQDTTIHQGSVDSNGMKLDGDDDHYDLTTPVNIGGNNPFTLFWVGQMATYDSPNGLFGDSTLGGSSAEITFTSSTTISIRGRGLEEAGTFVMAGAAFPIRTEMQICITKNANREINVYKDGTLLTPTSGLALGAEGFDISEIGAAPSAEATFTDGYIYELALYERELSYAEIQTISSYLSDKLL